MAYLVDTDDLLSLMKAPQQKEKGFLNSIFGTKTKPSEKDEILKIAKADFDEIDEGIIEQMEDNDEGGEYILSRVVLNEFLNDEIKESNYGQYYGYIFKILCEYKGQFLDNPEWYPCSTDNYFAIPFTSPYLPIKFPNPYSEPTMDYIKYTEIDLDNAKYENMDDDQKERLIDWFTQAINSKKDIYLFYH